MLQNDPSNPVNYPIQPIPPATSARIPKDQQELVPVASAITKRKYSTSIDPRNYLTVFEYKINDSWIIWDYYSGLVHLTGLWKAIGNSKADIVKLIDSSPELEPDLKRVRGGFLKIQGTWIPFEIARKLASRFCYKIRYALVPMFGESFVDECLKPYEKGFGMLRLKVSDEELKKKRSIRHKRTTSNGSISTAAAKVGKKPRSSSQDIGYQKLLPPLSPDIISRYQAPKSEFFSSTNQPVPTPRVFKMEPIQPKADGLLSVLRAAQNLDANPFYASTALRPSSTPLSSSSTTYSSSSSVSSAEFPISPIASSASLMQSQYQYQYPPRALETSFRSKLEAPAASETDIKRKMSISDLLI
ncbi:hypothetical protein OGAPHI_002118 [Ogataea philodendri]|uniref:HTH APSES-type domain-containing protein n=1 Tax=Ogataea philodendri TaxID=1378263 RepID=A0A9P8PBE0_9ASCO|nr:uncharacterized protein OGAPHI_002118 [Ogataea philodendri]KAH3668364.1 hypothetical protein OGAPHI_002118 [Ogataea philodendri]